MEIVDSFLFFFLFRELLCKLHCFIPPPQLFCSLFPTLKACSGPAREILYMVHTHEIGSPSPRYSICHRTKAEGQEFHPPTNQPRKKTSNKRVMTKYIVLCKPLPKNMANDRPEYEPVAGVKKRTCSSRLKTRKRLMEPISYTTVSGLKENKKRLT